MFSGARPNPAEQMEKQKRRFRILIGEDPIFSQIVDGCGRICPYCLKFVPTFGEQGEDIERFVLHLVMSCAHAHERDEDKKLHPLAAVRKCRNHMWVLNQVESDAAWRVTDQRCQWVCPYCMKSTNIAYTGSAEQYERLATNIPGHLHDCQEYVRHPKQHHSFDQIRAKVQNENNENKLCDQLRVKLKNEVPIWSQRTLQGHWVCPYCLVAQNTIAMDTEITRTKTAPVLITRHLLRDCASFGHGSGKIKFLDEVQAKIRDFYGGMAGDAQAASPQETSDEPKTILLDLVRSELTGVMQQLDSQKSLEKSRKRTKQIVKRQIPEKLPQPEGYELALFNLPCEDIGGDFFVCTPFKDGSFACAMGDVSRYGMESALIMGTARKALMIHSRNSSDPAEVLRRTNDDLMPDLDPGHFVPASYMHVNPAEHRVSYARAGGQYACVYVHKIGKAREIVTKGKPLGMVPGELFTKDLQKVHFQLGPGDVLLLFSDGASMARGPEKEMFNRKRILAILNSAGKGGARKLVDELSSAIIQFMGKSRQNDDMTLFAIGRIQ